MQLTHKNRLTKNVINESVLRRGLHFSVLTMIATWLSCPVDAGAVCQQGCGNNDNTFLGDGALSSTTTGAQNTATGSGALGLNTRGSRNTASGSGALQNNTIGSDNTAIGFDALSLNTTANSNTATGADALNRNTTGYRNTAIGYAALLSNTIAHGNTAIGYQALYHNTGSNNIGLGFNAGYKLTDGDGNICIGSNLFGVAGESNTTRIGNIYFSAASSRPVYIDSDGKLGTLVSSRRFKEEITPMDEASEAILALKPVSFRYKKEIEPNGELMFGLIAEDVEKVAPDLVTRNAKGEPETVRYEAVNAMLLNEFLKEHLKVEQQGRITEERDRTIQKQEEEIRALTSQLRRVNDQLDAIKSAPGVVTFFESGK
jgi:hypothetical protein